MQGRVLEIDGLRAIAMTMVVAQHCSLMPFGWIGVWIFFVISGYVITLSLMQDSEGSVLDRFRRFVTRRFFRIVPLYLLYLAIAFTLALSLGMAGVLGKLPTLLTFTYNWQMIYTLAPATGFGPLEHLWTLSVEEQFYIFYPFVVLLFTPQRSRKLMIGLLAAGPVIRYLTSLWSQTLSSDPGWLAFSVYANSFCHFDAFLAGALLARFREQITPRVTFLLAGVAAIATTAYGLTYWRINTLNGAEGVEALRNIFSGNLWGQGREVFVYSAVTLVAVAIMAAIVSGSWLTRPLAWRVLAHAGKVSYGGYVYHALVLYLIGSFMTVGQDATARMRLVEFFIGWPLTIAVATISYNLFERRFIGKRRPVATYVQSLS